MEDESRTDETPQNEQGPASPVIPAPRRPSAPAPAEDPQPTLLDEDPFAVSPMEREPAEVVGEPVAPAAGEPETMEALPAADPESVLPAAAETQDALPAADPGSVLPPAGIETEEALPPADPDAILPPAEAETEDAVPAADESLEDMVAGLRADETQPEPSADDAPDDVEGTAEAVAQLPEESAPTEETTLGEPDDRALKRRSARIPFWVYLLVWLVFAAVQTYLLWPFASAPFVDRPVYGILVLVGAGLVAAGPVLGLIVWWVVRSRSEVSQRTGLVRAVMLRTVAAMAGGSVIWWAALLLLDAKRMGYLG